MKDDPQLSLVELREELVKQHQLFIKNIDNGNSGNLQEIKERINQLMNLVDKKRIIPTKH